MNTQNSSNSIYDIIIRLLFLLLIVGWSLMIMYPFASIILWSLILAIAMFPLHKRLSKMMGGRKKLASAAIVLSILAVIFVPTWLLVDSLVGEVKDLKVSYEKGELSIPPPTDKVKEWPVIGDKLYDF
ncbi:MAG: AI-2E family transporter, partial [Ignavibacteria bacterium]|nr:AI-2E family transporter [Ignavibacteria bacterium]